jgi:hypothetical protein
MRSQNRPMKHALTHEESYLWDQEQEQNAGPDMLYNLLGFALVFTVLYFFVNL